MRKFRDLRSDDLLIEVDTNYVNEKLLINIEDKFSKSDIVVLTKREALRLAETIKDYARNLKD